MIPPLLCGIGGNILKKRQILNVTGDRRQEMEEKE